MKIGADSTDLALLSALSVLTCDRGVPLTRKQAKAVYKVQEAVGEILHKKCKQEGKLKKFTALIEVLALMRSTVKQVDLDKMRNYKAKIMSNPVNEDITDSSPQQHEQQNQTVRPVSRASTIDVETLSDISDPSQHSNPTSTSRSTTRFD